MNAQVLALLPLLITAGTVVAVMIGISVRRSHRVAAGLSIAGVSLALASIAPAWFGVDPGNLNTIFPNLSRFAGTEYGSNVGFIL